MELSERQKKHLRGLAHSRKPLVYVGKDGMSDGVARELDIALGAHELVKVGARVDDREEREQILAELAKRTSSSLVQRIGKIGVFYRASKDQPRITLPDG